MNFEISKDPINTQSVIDKVVQREAGAITTFIGTVRELTHGKKTLYLIYEAYEPMAVKKLEQIGREIEERWKGSKVCDYAQSWKVGYYRHCGSDCRFDSPSCRFL